MVVDMRSVPIRSSIRFGTMVSVGYEGRNLDGFISILKANSVAVLIDVRLNAISRKRGFSKRALSEALEANGIEYLHTPQLGNPKENRAGFRGPGIENAKKNYLAHLNNGSRPVYEAVVERARRERIALLCFESDDKNCHRSCIIEQAVVERPRLQVIRI
jgi:uncharacterized protein (DUF488 family)